MRHAFSILLVILCCRANAQKQEVIKYLTRLEFDSAWVASQAIQDAKERSVLLNLTTIIGHGGQQKSDSVLVADILEETEDPYEQLLRGNYHLYNGERGKALKYLLRSLEHFKASQEPLITINYLSLLHLYSRIFLSEKYELYLNEFKEIANGPYLEAWHYIYRLQYMGKIPDIKPYAEEYHSTYDEARRHFNRHDLNDYLEAHFFEKEAIFFRWTEDYDKALEAFEETVVKCEQRDFMRYLKFTALVELAGIQIKTGNIEEGKINIEKARNNWDQSDPILADLNFNLILALNYYEVTQQWDSAYFMIKEIFGLRLQDFNANNNVRISELQEEFNTELKDTEIKSQKRLISSQEDSLTALIVFLLLLLVLSVLLIYAFRNIRRKNQKIETLIRELHHRVKNNLQVISSLLGLQSMQLEDKNAQKAVMEGKGRIRAMSLIHQKLYQNDEVAILNVKEYLTNLIDDITRAYGYHEKAIISIRVPDATLNTDTTLPLGLVINELVSNSFKYAYKEVQTPVLNIDLRKLEGAQAVKSSQWELEVMDNGPGLPEELDIRVADSFGLRLVNLLIKQLHGKINYHNNEHGSTFLIQFPEKAMAMK